MGPKTLKLTAILRALAAHLARTGETHWSSWIESDIDEIERGDFHAIEHFLGAFGGMGSLNDVVLCPKNGHALEREDVDSANDELQRLLSEGYTLANEIRRVAEY